MPKGLKLEQIPKIKGDQKKVDTTRYSQLIGSLLHLSTFSRPDNNIGAHILRYLQGLKNIGSIYRKTSEKLHVSADASWSSDLNDRKSQNGFLFIYGVATILWASKKQRIVTTSSTEAEYVNLSSVAKEASFLRNLLEELGLHQGPVTIFTNLGIQGRTKHFDIRYHFVKEAIADNKIKS
ncbi:uncharacterized protein LOC129942049 [Eupeodes corollae]|uniref:uncharacterized protein LOC129942049 n=1 Tax=Eupeodes corollae TaxID=290404 RepID=UPI00249270BE|nr:uncharacterized protein LOC129942049 [Eupeodes corollae]